MNNELEYYYLFGLDIPLKKYNLGSIKQPKLIDFLEKDISIDNFYLPFIMNDILIGKSEDKESTISLKNKLGDLTFLLFSCYQAYQVEVLSLLSSSLSSLYNTDKIEIRDDFTILIDGHIEVNNSNFNILCDLILEMVKIDKSKLNLNSFENKQMSEVEKEFERRRAEYLSRLKDKQKKKGVELVDICNMLVHSGNFVYSDVLNMTIYQIKNSYETLIAKETFGINMLHRVSPKFDVGTEGYEHWVEKTKIDKSNLSKHS